MRTSTIVNADLLITPKWLKSYSACSDGYVWACSVIGEGLPLEKFLPLFNRADWMMWTLKRTNSLNKMTSVRIAIKCAEAVIDIYEKKYPKDDRPRKAINAAIAYVKDPSEENRKAAAAAADAANAAADDAAYAANAAANAASSAAYAAYDAAYAANAAADDAAAAANAAHAAARTKMHKQLCAMILKEFGL